MRKRETEGEGERGTETERERERDAQSVEVKNFSIWRKIEKVKDRKRKRQRNLLHLIQEKSKDTFHFGRNLSKKTKETPKT